MKKTVLRPIPKSYWITVAFYVIFEITVFYISKTVDINLGPNILTVRTFIYCIRIYMFFLTLYRINFISMKENLLTEYIGFFPLKQLKFKDKLYMSASIKIGEKRITEWNGENKYKLRNADLNSQNMSLWMFFSDRPIPDIGYHDNPWMRKKSEEEKRAEEERMDMANPLELHEAESYEEKEGFIKIAYCETYFEAVREFYQNIDVKNTELFSYSGKERIF